MSDITTVRAADRAWLSNPDGAGEFAPLRANEADGGTIVVRMTAGSLGKPTIIPEAKNSSC